MACWAILLDCRLCASKALVSEYWTPLLDDHTTQLVIEVKAKDSFARLSMGWPKLQNLSLGANFALLLRQI